MLVINCPQEERRGSLNLKTTVSESVRQMCAQLHCIQGNYYIKFIFIGVILKNKNFYVVYTYILSNSSDFLFIRKEDAGRRQVLLIWLCIVCTLNFIHDCQLHKNIL